MSEWWHAAVAAVVQGITEFLPVSSSGHLRLVGHFFGLDEPATAVDISLHLATLLSVLLVFRDDLRAQMRPASHRRSGQGGPLRLAGLVIVGSLPAAFVGIGFGDDLEAMSASLQAIGYAYLANATILLVAHGVGRKKARRSLDAMPFGHALLIGCAQAFAIVRGISRSGSTITAALVLGYGASEAAFFSFLLAIPAIGGAALLKLLPLLEGGAATAGMAAGPLLVGFVLSFVVGVAALRLLLASARRAVWWPYVLWSGALAGMSLSL